jgi:hypothetical protein
MQLMMSALSFSQLTHILLRIFFTFTRKPFWKINNNFTTGTNKQIGPNNDNVIWA